MPRPAEGGILRGWPRMGIVPSTLKKSRGKTGRNRTCCANAASRRTLVASCLIRHQRDELRWVKCLDKGRNGGWTSRPQAPSIRLGNWHKEVLFFPMHHSILNAWEWAGARVPYRWGYPPGTPDTGGPRASQGRNSTAWGGSWRPLLARGTRYRKCPAQALITLTLSITSSK